MQPVEYISFWYAGSIRMEHRLDTVDHGVIKHATHQLFASNCEPLFASWHKPGSEKLASFYLEDRLRAS